MVTLTIQEKEEIRKALKPLNKLVDSLDAEERIDEILIEIVKSFLADLEEIL